MYTQTKSWLTSKKVWFNLLTIVTVIATYFGYVPDQDVANKVSTSLLALGPIVNFVLATFYTKKPITFLGK